MNHEPTPKTWKAKKGVGFYMKLTEEDKINIYYER
ncbi:hypothetical protein M2475_002269, partial [Breznakia sp. PF5-3]|nr:hypothetical protein [Breznakia sp. PF5-3]